VTDGVPVSQAEGSSPKHERLERERLQTLILDECDVICRCAERA
jgi:hypothetical protein